VDLTLLNRCGVGFESSATFPLNSGTGLASKLIPKVRAGGDLRVGIDISVEVEGASNLESELRLILKHLELEGRVKIESA